MDLLIKNGRVIDGTGNPYYKADIGIVGEQILCIDRIIDPTCAKRVVDARELIICPGFIDSHAHDDISLLVKPTCDEKVLQGVTTTIIGNCGDSVAPISDEFRTDMRDHLRLLGGEYIPEELSEIASFGDYLRKLELAKPGINVISLVGHCTVRIAVIGPKKPIPSEGELIEMKRLIGQAMKEGAFGLSTGLVYAPAYFAETHELIELAKVVREFKGVYASHIRSEGNFEINAIEEAIKIGEKANVPVQISHHKVSGKNNWGKSVETLKMMAEARDKGIEVTCDQYPYDAGSTFLSAILPPSVLSGVPGIYCQKLKDQNVRESVIKEMEKSEESFIKSVGFENMVIAVSANHLDYVGKSIAEIARMECKSPYDVIFDLVVEEERNTIANFFMMNDVDINRIMSAPFTMIGSDGIPGFGKGKPHPRLTGTFPRVLGKYVREEHLLSIEEAIRKMTSLPAQTFGMKKKGLLKEGFDADIVIFNQETILDKSTYEDPTQKPEGIIHVLVNGKFAVESGKVTSSTSGKVLRHKM